MDALMRRWSRLPVVLAPMAGVSTPALVAAAARAGVFGFHGGAFQTPADLGKTIDAIRELAGNDGEAQKSFGVNLFALYDREEDAKFDARVASAREHLEPLYARLGAEMPGPVAQPQPMLREQLEVLLEKKVPAFSFCFGRIAGEDIARLQRNGTLVFGTATSVAEAKLLENDGVDAIIAQGAEAGGHRGSFLPESSLVGTMSLVPQIVDSVRIPVLAAGGIADARGVGAALCLGARAACLGTAFLTSADSEADDAHKQCILSSAETETVCTDVFSGRAARGLVNDFVEMYDQGLASSNHNKARVLDQRDNVAPYPVQQSLAAPLKKASTQQVVNGKSEGHLRSMWSGQSPRLCTGDSVEVIVQRISAALEGFTPVSPTSSS